MASPRPSRKILFLKDTTLVVAENGGLDVCGPYADVLFSLTRTERECWIKNLEVTGPVWDVLTDASGRNFYERGEIVIPYRQLVHEDAVSELTVRIQCTNDDTCLETRKEWLHRRESFAVHDTEKSILIDWLKYNFV